MTLFWFFIAVVCVFCLIVWFFGDFEEGDDA